MSILDYGCAHGHYAMNLQKYLPDMIENYVGIDIAENNITAAKKWKEACFLDKSISFFEGDIKKMPISIVENQLFDTLLLGEVLEHVIDPAEIVNALSLYVKPDGYIIITTPYGAWEAMDWDKHPTWCRAHVWHFEKQDLEEMFRRQKAFEIYTLPHPADNKFGHYITIFKNSKKDVELYDLNKKRWNQNPKKTVSVCIIAKNEEERIGYCIEKIQSIADEIIIGIDRTTYDSTIQVIQREIKKHSIGIDYFLIDSPIKTGFDVARNATIKRATMDYILWIDADETLEQAENLDKYLIDNLYDGYAIPQHHYAVEPAALYKTDYPIRLFKNRRGIKFFGVVHEHPETGLNEGVGNVRILKDVSIMHTGYATEKIRRKRFNRNWPLMQRDREKYPERMLGHFLFLRDLAHVNKYEYEKKKIITKEMTDRCNQIRELFLDFIKKEELRFCLNSLQFYSEAAMLMTKGFGISTNIMLALNKDGGHKYALEDKGSLKIEGMFFDKQDLSLLIDMILKQKLEKYDNKYF